MPAPIRTALVGLSAASDGTSWASRAHLPYLLSPAGRDKFEIVALVNSSADAARRAIQAFDLPPNTRAYGSPDDLATDPDVQLVIVATRVDRHFDGALPSLRAGKDVLVEWPLAENGMRAEELAAVAGERGVRGLVALQAWFEPSIVKLAEITASGRIGKVLSSEVRAAGGVYNRDWLPPGLKYFTDRKVGGNPFTIGFAHLFDYVQHVLGDVQDLHSHLQLQRPQIKIVEQSTNEVKQIVESNVPDLTVVVGSLPGSEHIVPGATIYIRFRTGAPFNGEPTMAWYINGEKGEIRLIAHGGPSMQIGGPVDIEVEDFESGEVVKIPFEAASDLPMPARNIASLYERYYAKGSLGEYPTFEHALKRHRQLDDMLAKFTA